jgi:leader peptidase (prepilin peptidase)/N-methyltransferase
MLIDLMIIVILFLLGISVGSFLNVVADRVPAGMSIIRPPSYCFTCSHELQPRDMVPVLSYLMLRGRCRYCGQQYPARSMLVELATGLAFVLAYQVFGLGWQYWPAVIFCCVYIVIFVTDLEQDTVPYPVVLPAIVLAVLFAAFSPLTGTLPGLVSCLVGLAIGMAVLTVPWLGGRLSKNKWVSPGDICIAGLIGASVGFKYVFVAFYTVVIAGLILILAAAVLHKRSTILPLPLSALLAAGGFIAIFLGGDIVDTLPAMFP